MKQILSEEFRRMQKLAGIVTELDYSDQEKINIRNNRILFDKFKAPEKITLQITNTGKEQVKFHLLSWIPHDKRVPYQIDIKDKVTLDRSLTEEDMTRRIGEIRLDIGGREVPDFCKFIGDDEDYYGFGKEMGTGQFSVFAEYFPESNNEGQLTASIGVTKGLERLSAKSTKKNLQKVNDCEFKKIEVGEVDDRGWFKIVSVN